jgi:hypothetical protein
MDLVTIGLIIITVAIVGSIFIRVRRGDKRNSTTPSFESLYDHERLEQLINIAGGDSIAQLVRLYNIRGTELAFAHQKSSIEVRSLTRDRILLFHEINRINQLQQEKKINYSIITRYRRGVIHHARKGYHEQHP